MCTDCDAPERWLPVLDQEGRYEVSSHGRVRSLPRERTRGVILRGVIGKRHGYHSVGIRYGTKNRTRKVHILVAEAFHEARPDGLPDGLPDTRHLDGNKLHNHPDNLRFGTRSENKLDEVEHGNHPNARKTHCPRGHEYTPANTYLSRGGRGRQCVICTRATSKAAREKAAELRAVNAGVPRLAR